MTTVPTSIDAVETLLSGQGYVASRALATVVFLSLRLNRLRLSLLLDHLRLLLRLKKKDERPRS